MPPTKRRHVAGLIEQLLCEPQRFGFFQTVRLLDRWLGAGGEDRQGGLSRLHFRNSLSLSFPACEIESLLVHKTLAGENAYLGTPVPEDSVPSALGRTLKTTQADVIPSDPSEVQKIDITPAFMGLLGVNGTLPLFYTEMLAQRELYQKDQSARAFMDVFSHRALTMFYQAWRKHRLDIEFEADQRNRYMPLVLSLAGLGSHGLRDRLGARAGGVPDESIAYYAGAVQQRTLSATQLQQLLRDYFAVPVRIEQFVGRWYHLPEAGRFHLGQIGKQAHERGALNGALNGALSGVLGKSAMLGERVWQRDLRLRIVLGPLSHWKFQRFLPGGPGAKALKEWLMLLSGVSLEYEINLCLQHQDVRGTTLNSARPENASRLGWDTYLQTRSANEDRVDVRYDIHAAA